MSLWDYGDDVANMVFVKITRHIKISHMLLFRIQGSLAWIGLWRQLFAKYNFFQSSSAIHKTKNWVGLEIKCHMWMWCFHKYYVLHFKFGVNEGHFTLIIITVSNLNLRWTYWAWLWYRCSIAITIKHCSTFSSALSMGSHRCLWVHQGHDMALDFMNLFWLIM